MKVNQESHMNPKGEGHHLVLLVRQVRLGESDPSQNSNSLRAKPKHEVQHISPTKVSSCEK